MQTHLDDIRQKAQIEISKAETPHDLLNLRSHFIGKKSPLNDLMKQLGSLPPAERPAFGKQINDVKSAIETLLTEAETRINASLYDKSIKASQFDYTMPGRPIHLGNLHPLTKTQQLVEDVLISMGYQVAEGFDVEDEFHNFDALNTPQDHPSRNLADTFYIQCPVASNQCPEGSFPNPEHRTPNTEHRTPNTEHRTPNTEHRTPNTEHQTPNTEHRTPNTEHRTPNTASAPLLRTQTSTVQVRVMESYKPPIKIISPGRCYRNDKFDMTHSPVFHQVEGLVVDEGISFKDLRDTINTFVKKVFGADCRFRFRPHFFPFTEPSAEVDISCFACGGSGCPTCKQSGWIELMGAGMVDPNVFEMCGIDSEKYTGFAFGMGIDRLTMMRYHIPDIRLLYENDLRLLSQF